METEESYALLSKETPLIANLDMKENIALIREVHHRLKITVAQKEAVEMLKKIALGDIADKRQRECTQMEKFYVMLIRAMMSDAEKILISLPFSIVDATLDMKDLVTAVRKLDSLKEIIVLDTIANKSHYDKISDQKVVIDAL